VPSAGYRREGPRRRKTLPQAVPVPEKRNVSPTPSSSLVIVEVTN
jgi:hypothetical protein